MINMQSNLPSVMIVGYSETYHIGARLYDAALDLGAKVVLCDANQAYKAPKIVQSINWRLRDHRPAYLDAFSDQVVDSCMQHQPSVLLVTGMLPPNAESLQKIRRMGIICVNYLTDDPWNRSHSSTWFLHTLPYYDVVFSPRRANILQLQELAQSVEYLPFAFDPKIHFPEPAPFEEQASLGCDVLFYGGADKDRLPYIEDLIDDGINVHLYGGYWERYQKTRRATKGMANAQKLRWAITSSKIVLCLVRQANRDGHVMRTFEAPAMGACMLAEETQEHCEIFGADETAVLYFRTREELLERVHLLLNDEIMRKTLAKNANHLILSNAHTYQDRLKTMLNFASRLQS